MRRCMAAADAPYAPPSSSPSKAEWYTYSSLLPSSVSTSAFCILESSPPSDASNPSPATGPAVSTITSVCCPAPLPFAYASTLPTTFPSPLLCTPRAPGGLAAELSVAPCQAVATKAVLGGTGGEEPGRGLFTPRAAAATTSM